MVTINPPEHLLPQVDFFSYIQNCGISLEHKLQLRVIV